MGEFVALLRGVNVGGVKVVMEDLRAMATGLGWQQAETLIASGNLMFRCADDAACPDLAKALEAAMHDHYGRGVPLVILSAADFHTVLAQCPYAPEDGKQAHGYFPLDGFAFDAALYDSLRQGREEVILTAGAAWLFAPDGIGRSKLAEKMEKVLGGRATGRNLNTLRKLAERLDARGAAC